MIRTMALVGCAVLWATPAHAGKKSDGGSRYVEVGEVTCREPIEEVARSLDAEVKAQYLAFSAGGKASYSQQVQRLDGLSADQKVRERLEFKICMDYGNGLLTKEEYKLWSLLLDGDEAAKATLHSLALGEQRQVAKEVAPPTSCSEPPMAAARVLVDAGELLRGGRSGEARAEDLKALAMLETAAQGDSSAAVWAAVARARLYAGQSADRVREAADKASAACPTWGVPDNYAGGALVLAKQLEPAKAAFTTATHKSPDYAFAYYNLGAVELGLSQVAAGVSALDKALAVDPQLGEAAYLKGRVLAATGDTAGAIASLRRATELLPTDAQAWAALGDALEKAGDPGANAANCKAKELGADVSCG